MTRPLLSLYRLDRAALGRFSGELRDALGKDDRAAIALLLGLGDELTRRVLAGPRVVDLMLQSESAAAAPLLASLCRVAKRAALEHVWSSESPALEGRLRAYDILRDEEDVAKFIDRLLDASRLPWFFQRPGGTGGWLCDEERVAVAERMAAHGAVLPDELNAFVEALGGMDGDALVHDRL